MVTTYIGRRAGAIEFGGKQQPLGPGFVTAAQCGSVVKSTWAWQGGLAQVLPTHAKLRRPRPSWQPAPAIRITHTAKRTGHP